MAVECGIYVNDVYPTRCHSPQQSQKTKQNKHWAIINKYGSHCFLHFFLLKIYWHLQSFVVEGSETIDIWQELKIKEAKYFHYLSRTWCYNNKVDQSSKVDIEHG